MCLSISIPYGESFEVRIFETSCGHNAQRRNNNPYKAVITEKIMRREIGNKKIIKTESIISNIRIRVLFRFSCAKSIQYQSRITSSECFLGSKFHPTIIPKYWLLRYFSFILQLTCQIHRTKSKVIDGEFLLFQLWKQH